MDPTDVSLVAIVDDHESCRRSVERLVRSAGFRVKTAGSAEDFLERGNLDGTAPRFEEVLQRASSRTSIPEDGLSAFLSVRPRLFGIAYRMLGSAVEAEDIVQDVWVRWQTADRSLVRDATAFFVTTTTRLAINVIQSARSRREMYIERWLPEPVDASTDPRLGMERGQALASGVQLLLEKLTPTERAAYILREAFDYSYREIANVLRLEEANARQVVTRARLHVANGRRIPASSIEQRRLLAAFIAAAQHGNVAGLEGLLASDARLHLRRRRLGAAGGLPVVGRRGRGQGSHSAVSQTTRSRGPLHRSTIRIM